MAKKYKGSLSLEWFNKQKAIVNLNEDSIKSASDIPAPRINWINKEEALFYELNEEEGKGNTPYWVNRDDIRVKEARPLVFQKAFKAIEQDKEFTIQEIGNEEEALDIENMLIKGDNLLALNTLKKHFDKLPENEKVKCIYIDPPFNTEQAFEHYDDNLEHSEWLSLMRDRLVLLKPLLRNDGFIAIHIDEKEYAYLKILCDEVFGRFNFVNTIVVRDSHPSGLKLSSKEKKIIKTKSHVAIYRASENSRINPIYQKRDDWDTHYSIYFDHTQKPFKRESLRDKLLELKVIDKKFRVDSDALKSKEFRKFCFDNRDKIFQSTKELPKEAKEKSLSNRDEVVDYNDSEGNQNFAYNGRRLFPLSRSLQNVGIDNGYEEDFAKLLCDFWDDVDFNNSQNEGGVSFPNSKKPEYFVARLLTMFSDKGDVLLDCFGGSGTTFAVAHKMNRKWIGLEIGNHADTHITPRLSNILSGKDQSGISKSVNWQGGGSFKYYHLGESIISIDEETKKGEFNWSLGKQFIQESLLQSYDFVVQDINVFPAQIFQDEENKPTVGKIVGTSNRAIYGLAFLATPKESNLTITNEEVKTIYSTLKKQSDFQSLVIYSNKGIDIAQDTIPEDLAIIKVPHAIFSELER